ncbi:uncharacterized protein L203_102926 [Cryptococcus depauperatus CBS 7841]|uniref:Uncharacterized protein n=1 Tax=Cryptococcus depauperatus CBS 7841 TaxID=1295531 RepID=A0A1E3IB55_9TREE|nr:hypothetical protein L203_04731 [Cryptococcus depauperatus CBS 7841]
MLHPNPHRTPTPSSLLTSSPPLSYHWTDVDTDAVTEQDLPEVASTRTSIWSDNGTAIPSASTPEEAGTKEGKLIDFSDDEASKKKPMNPRDKLRDLLRQMDNEAALAKARKTVSKPRLQALVDGPIAGSSLSPQESEGYSPPTPPPRFGNPYARRKNGENGTREAGRLPSRAAVLLQTSLQNVSETDQEQDDPSTQLQTYIVSHSHSDPSSSRSVSYINRSESPESLRKGKGKEIIGEVNELREVREKFSETSRRKRFGDASRRQNSRSPSPTDPTIQRHVQQQEPTNAAAIAHAQHSLRCQSTTPTPRRSTIDPIPHTHEQFASDLKGLEIRTEVELDLDEGMSVGWENSLASESISSAKNKDSGAVAESEQLEIGGHFPTSPFRSHSRSRSLNHRPSTPPLPALPDVSAARSEDSIADTYSSRRATLFRNASTTQKEVAQQKPTENESSRKSLVGSGQVTISSRSWSQSPSQSHSPPYSTSEKLSPLHKRLKGSREEEVPKQIRFDDQHDLDEMLHEGDGDEEEVKDEKDDVWDSRSSEKIPSPARGNLHTLRTADSGSQSTPARVERFGSPKYTSKSGVPSFNSMITPKPPGAWKAHMNTSMMSLQHSRSPLTQAKGPEHAGWVRTGATPKPPGAWTPVHSQGAESGQKVRFSPLRYEAGTPSSKRLKGGGSEEEEKEGDVSILRLKVSPRQPRVKTQDPDASWTSKLRESLCRISIPIRSTTYTKYQSQIEKAQLEREATGKRLRVAQSTLLSSLSTTPSTPLLPEATHTLAHSASASLARGWRWTRWLWWLSLEIFLLWGVFRMTLEYAQSGMYKSWIDPFGPMAQPLGLTQAPRYAEVRGEKEQINWANARNFGLDVPIPGSLRTLIGLTPGGRVNFFDLVANMGWDLETLLGIGIVDGEWRGIPT